MRRTCPSSLVLALVVLSACARPTPPPVSPPPPPPVEIEGEVEAVSLLGQPLVAPELPAEVRRDREAKLAEARAAVEARPDDPDALLWLGRRTAYLGRYREAIEIFSRGASRFPRDARFLRHRGHRHLSLRRFDLAAADLEAAARLVAGRPDEVEPDGLPNAAGIPTSTLHSNIWYHLGLARYLQGDFAAALPALAVASGPAAAADLSGALCIAPFHVEEPKPGEPPLISGPNMSQTTWGPAARSVFTFRIDKRPRVAVRNHEMMLISGLPTDRKVKVEVRLDDRPFETFRLNLGDAREHRICLWLYPGYWHWIDQGWNPKLGCKCEVPAKGP
jgi:hypothetical protein